MTGMALGQTAVLLERLTALAQLQPDWDGYGAYTPAPEAVLAAQCLLLHLQDFNSSYLPNDVAPLPDGGVELEWIDGDASRQLYIEATATGCYTAFLIDETSGTRHTRSWVHALYRDLHQAIQTFLAP